MGMFDEVNAPPITCKCGGTVSGWQSKDGPCTLSMLPVSEVDQYYSICDQCRAFHLFERVVPPETPFKHFIDGSPT